MLPSSVFCTHEASKGHAIYDFQKYSSEILGSSHGTPQISKFKAFQAMRFKPKCAVQAYQTPKRYLLSLGFGFLGGNVTLPR
jgi:hypothetical protein